MNSDTIPTLSFDVEGECHAVPLVAVREVIRSVSIRDTHDSEGVEGYINLRGSIIPVVDIRRLLGLTASDNQPEHRLLVIEHANAKFALRSSQLPQIHEATFEACAGTHSLIEGVSGRQTQVIKLLNVDRVAAILHSNISVTSISEA